MANKFVHIGLGKAGSSFLQKAVFKNLPIKYLGKNGESDDINELILSLATDSSFIYDDCKFKERLSTVDAGKVLISEEMFAAHTFTDPELIAIRLKRLLGDDVKLLLITRNVEDWLNSQFMYRLEMGQPDVLHGADAWCKKVIKWQKVGNPLMQIYYSKLYDTYARVFGSDKITVIPYEMLKKEPNKFYIELDNFFGLDNGVVSNSLLKDPVRRYKKRMTADHYELIMKIITNRRKPNFIKNVLSDADIEFVWRERLFINSKKYRYKLFSKIISQVNSDSNSPARVDFDMKIIELIKKSNYQLDEIVREKYGISSQQQ